MYFDWTVAALNGIIFIFVLMSHISRPNYSCHIQHALERHAAAVRQLPNGTNGDVLYICIATVENTIQTVNSPIYE